MDPRLRNWMVVGGFVAITVVGAVVAVLLLARPAVCESAPAEGGDHILGAVYQLARAIGPIQREVLRGFKDGEAQLPFTFTGELTGIGALVPASPAGQTVFQFTCDGAITGTDSFGNQQLVRGKRAFQLLAGEDPEDIDVAALAEVLVGACDGLAVDVESPSECITPTVEGLEPAWYRKPRDYLV